MFNLFGQTRNYVRILAASVMMIGLSACGLNFEQMARGSINVALLLPYNSEAAGDHNLAQSLENAARLAASDVNDTKINITVYPTEAQPAITAQMTRKAIEEGADIIIGPLRSNSANAASVAAANSKVNILSFSNNASVAGDNLFILGNTYENSARRIMRFAAANGQRRTVVIYPGNTVGEIAMNAVAKAAQDNGVSAVGVPFEFSHEGVVEVIPLVEQTIKDTGATSILLTSDTSGALPLMAPLLPERGIDPEQVKYMGLARWDVPTATLNLPSLQGGWFVLPDPALTARFDARYSAAYGKRPHPLAALAYDGVAAVGALAAKRLALTQKNLKHPSGFAGANGIFRFNADGTIERALAVAQVTEGQVQIIAPAPRSFSRNGS